MTRNIVDKEQNPKMRQHRLVYIEDNLNVWHSIQHCVWDRVRSKSNGLCSVKMIKYEDKLKRVT